MNGYASFEWIRSRRTLGQEGYAARPLGDRNVAYPDWIGRAGVTLGAPIFPDVPLDVGTEGILVGPSQPADASIVEGGGRFELPSYLLLDASLSTRDLFLVPGHETSLALRAKTCSAPRGRCRGSPVSNIPWRRAKSFSSSGTATDGRFAIAAPERMQLPPERCGRRMASTGSCASSLRIMRKPKRASDTPPENGSAPVPPSSDKAAAHVRELDAQALLHELRVHQFELEMQNEELRRARGEMEIALRLYTEIFDFSPIGYATIQADYVIVNVNFAACEMLRRPRALLNGMSFERFVAYPCRVHFCALIGEAWSSGEKQTRQLDLLEEGAKEICVRLSAIPLLRTQPTILLAIEALASEALASEPPPLNAN